MQFVQMDRKPLLQVAADGGLEAIPQPGSFNRGQVDGQVAGDSNPVIVFNDPGLR
jgi:hypothetical protein